MTEPEPRIVALIDVYAPAAAGTPDWQDVVRRASAPVARRLFTAPRLLLIAAALAVLLAGSALAGVGPGRILLGLVRDDEPVPRHGEARAGPHVPVAARHARHRGRVAARLPPDRGDAVGRRRTGHHAGRRELDRAAPRRRVLRRTAFSRTGEGYSYSCVHGPLNPDVRLIQESPAGGGKRPTRPCTGIRGSWTAPSRSRPRGSCSCTATARKRRCRCGAAPWDRCGTSPCDCGRRARPARPGPHHSSRSTPTGDGSAWPPSPAATCGPSSPRSTRPARQGRPDGGVRLDPRHVPGPAGNGAALGRGQPTNGARPVPGRGLHERRRPTPATEATAVARRTSAG